MAPQKTQATKKVVKKSFFEVKAPLTSTKIALYATSAESLDGKVVKLDLTKTLRGKSLELKLRIKNHNGSLEADPEKIALAMSYVINSMRKGTDYVEDSFEAECRDCISIIKPLLITRKRVSRSVLKALREETKKQLLVYAKTRTAHELFSEIMTNKLQKQLSLKLKKIYPLGLCEIRVFEIKSKKDIVSAPSISPTETQE